jgi:hypothetical protein
VGAEKAVVAIGGYVKNEVLRRAAAYLSQANLPGSQGK